MTDTVIVDAIDIIDTPPKENAQTGSVNITAPRFARNVSNNV
jgi:hypothetical protein